MGIERLGEAGWGGGDDGWQQWEGEPGGGRGRERACCKGGGRVVAGSGGACHLPCGEKGARMEGQPCKEELARMHLPIAGASFLKRLGEPITLA